MNTNRYFIQICYDGTLYHGWQKQKNALTVQGKIDNALSTVLGEEILTTGCGRTDAGVHALIFFAHFDSEKKLSSLSSPNLLNKINALLPADIAVNDLFPVIQKANSRFDAISRTYEYHITTEKNPLLNNRAYLVHKCPDLVAMSRCAEELKKHRDFTTFSKTGSDVKNYECTVFESLWEKRKDVFYGNGLIVYRITANRFLRGMVRAIAGTMLNVGKGAMTFGQFKDAVVSKDRSKAAGLVPPCGLYLTGVEYP